MRPSPAASPPQAALLQRFSSSLPVERVQPDRLGEMCDFFRRAYADQPLASSFQDPTLVERRWRWLYNSRPVQMEGETPAWVCRLRDRIVGYLGILPAVAVVRGQAVPVAWARDLIVAPEARSLGVGALLVLAARQAVGRPLLVAGMNEQSASLFRQLGFLDGGTLPLYVKLYEPSRVLETLPWTPLRRRLVGATIRSGQSLSARVARLGHRREGVEVVPLERFDDRFDRWWAGIEPLFPCVVRRTAETMRWRYEDHPTHHYHVVAARAGDAMRGVVVMRRGCSRGLPAGFITELLARPDDRAALDGLLDYAQTWLLEAGETAPAFLRSSVRHPAIEQALARAGFLPAASPFRLMISREEAQPNYSALRFHEDCFFNAGDSDLDIF